MSGIRRGTIREFVGSWGSGIAFLSIEDSETGETEQVPCDNGPTVRALEEAFNNVIAPGHTVDGEGGHLGQEVFWSYGDMGFVLGWFVPVEEAPLEMVEAYESGGE